MNYRHAFHAGNFADIVKHAALLLMLRPMMGGEPLTVIDTHGGAGAYSLTSDSARKSGEAAAGILRLMADDGAPQSLAPLKQAVRRFNRHGPVRNYPGSPVLIAEALRKQDRLVTCELRPDDHGLLKQALAPFSNATALRADGYAMLANEPLSGPTMVLIDPPFERPDDYARCVDTVDKALAKNPAAAIAIWLPLKDLETFDAFLRRLEEVAPDALVAEVRLRPLHDPMRMNGCALAIANPPEGLATPLEEACGWVVSHLGEAGGRARLWRLDQD